MRCDLEPTGRSVGEYREYRCTREGCGRVVESRHPSHRTHVPCRAAKSTTPRKQSRAGDFLAFIVWLLAGEEPEDCNCRSWVRRMNAWGWQRSWAHRREILEALAANARKRGYDVQPTWRSMIWAAFRAVASRWGNLSV